jgi:multidrug efflux system membrane fusion protein
LVSVMRKQVMWVALVLAVALAALVGRRQWRSGAPAPAEAEVAAPVGVSVATAQRRSLPILLEAAGRAEAKASVSVKSRLDGQVVELAYREGHPVRKGQLLIRLDASAVEAQLRQAEGVVARDQAQLLHLQGDYERNRSLFQQGFLSAGGFKLSEADLKSAEATLAADRAGADNARLQVGYTRIVAPMAGVAGAALLPVGGAAKANDTPLLVINQIDPIYVSFALPEAQLAPLVQALKRGPVPVRAAVAGIAQPALGELAFIDNAVDPATGTIAAKAVFANADARLTPGQFAQVSVQLGAQADALVVPAQAVESGVDGAYVFVVNADGTVTLRAVQTGVQSAGYRVVTAGLAAGDQVVMTGQARLRDKARVVVAAGASASAGSAP